MTSHDGGQHERKDHGAASRQPSACDDSRDGKPVQKRLADDGGATTRGTLERTAALIAVIVPLGLAISFAYDWGFFSALGLRFADVPTSIPDHLRTWLVWSPAIIPAVLVFLGFELLTRRIEQGRTENEIVALSPSPARAKIFRTLPWKLIRWMCAAVLAAWILVGYNRLLGLAATVCWIWLMEWVFSHPIVLRRHSLWLILMVVLAPTALILFFSLGYRSVDFNKNDITAYVEIFNDGSDSASAGSVLLETHVMRSFGNWLLVREKSGTILWIRSDRVDRMQLAGDRVPFRGVLCSLVDVCIDFEENRSSSPSEPVEMLTDTLSR